MNTSKFYQLLKETEVEYDGDLAVINIRKDNVVIDVYMYDNDTELQIEECSFDLSDKQIIALTNKINKAVSEVKEEEENFNGAFIQDDYLHFLSLIA